MLIIPAIDIRAGKVVRLTQGKFEAKKIYSNDPLRTARHWQQEGAGLIHLVNLDGASRGEIKNLKLIKKLVKKIDVPIQYGGGVRQIKNIRDLLNIGIYRVVIGTRALDKDFLSRVYERFKEQVIVSIDVRSGKVFTKGWSTEGKGISAIGLAKAVKRIGFREVIFTDILRDGTLKGPNIEGTRKILDIGLRVIHSGGISSLSDIFGLLALEPKGLTAVIVGKALYEARFTLGEAIKKTKKKEVGC